MVTMNEYQNARRQERIRGHPGVWATRKPDGWTIYTVKGIYKAGIESEKTVRKILAQVKLRVNNGKQSAGKEG
jgi:hypothetical protein